MTVRLSVEAGEGIPAPKRIYKTFAELVEGREVECPTLAAAVRNSVPAESIQIEWLTPNGEHWKNYTQIFRFPYRGATPEGSVATGGDTNAARALDQFLSAVEMTLIDGVPHRETTGAPISWCGGYKHFLGRELGESDVLVLRPLREPFLWEHEWKRSGGEWYALDTPEFEWLAEISLQVIPAK